MGLGIVVGADTAGYDCGETLTEGFGVDEHVSEVVDFRLNNRNTGVLNIFQQDFLSPSGLPCAGDYSF